MYTRFYGLKEKPFEITPDPRFLYLTENHQEALAHLTYAMKGRKGFTVITGEAGTGKTTLIHAFLSRLDVSTKTAYVFNPRLDATDFLHSICEDFDLGIDGKSKGQYLSQLHKYLLACYAKQENVVLIIDEAQDLDPFLLEEVRLLTNLETAKNKLLQVVMMGQPELNDILNRPESKALKQRVTLRYHISPLSKEETRQYIKRRLIRAGARAPNLFTPKAVDRVYSYTRGIPRLINIVCDNSLLSGYAADQKAIDDQIVRRVTRQLEGKGTRRKNERRGAYIGGILTAMMSLGLLAIVWKFYFLGVVESGIGRWTNVVAGIVEKIYGSFPSR
jgi:general secretion pathway protein A